ncbi:MAG: NfeD family protein [Bacteroidota bacterium]
MEWITVAALIIIGLLLIVVEIIFVPGTTFVGILGFILAALGVYFTFDYYGSATGVYVMGGTLFVFAICLYYGFKSNAWERFSLKTKMEGKFNEGRRDNLKVGDEGQALSALRPIGKAEFDGVEYEVSSLGDYIEAESQIKIIKIDINNIFVEPN